MQRKYIDCRDQPSQMNCSLKLSGSEDEVLRAAIEHSVSVHGHKDSPELRDRIRKGLRDEIDTDQAAPQPLSA